MSRPPRRPAGPRPPSRNRGEGHSSFPDARSAAPGRPGRRPRDPEPSEAHAPHRDAPPREPSGRDAPGRGAPERGVPRERGEPGTHWLYGLHAVAAALANPRRRLRRLLLTAEAEQALLAQRPKPWPVQAERAERGRFQTFLPEDAVHQGAALLCEPLPPTPLEAALARSRGPVLLLDQVTDPRNVGAILRSAAAFGAAAVIMQDRNAPPETAAMARAAAGALEVVPVVREVNLARTIQMLQRAGYWVMGLAGEAQAELAKAKPKDRPVALVLGAEDSGLRRLQRETCDELVRLPITGAVESLNVSVAAAVALYELVRGT